MRKVGIRLKQSLKPLLDKNCRVIHVSKYKWDAFIKSIFHQTEADWVYNIDVIEEGNSSSKYGVDATCVDSLTESEKKFFEDVNERGDFISCDPIRDLVRCLVFHHYLDPAFYFFS